MAHEMSSRRSLSPTRMGLTPYQYARESMSPVRSWTEGTRPAAISGHSTQHQLAHTAYLFGEPDQVSHGSGRLSLTLTGAAGLPVIESPSPSKLSSGARPGTVGENMLNQSATSYGKPSPSIALIKKGGGSKATHGHLAYERAGVGPLEDRRRETTTWARKDHPFEPSTSKLWGGEATSHKSPAWPYNDRVRGGHRSSPTPMGLMKDVPQPKEGEGPRPVTSNQNYGAHGAQSPHDAKRGRPTTPHSIGKQTHNHNRKQSSRLLYPNPRDIADTITCCVC